MHKPEEYGVSVRLVQEDGLYLYEARVLELPDVRTYGETYSEAYLGAIEVIQTTQQIFAEKGRAFPEIEVPEDEFSGRVTLRMSKSLHRSVHSRAQRDGVSLNQWIVECVASRVDGAMIPRNSIYLASPHFSDAHDGPVLQVQHAKYMTSLAPNANVFFIQSSGDLSAHRQQYVSGTAIQSITTDIKHHG